MGVMQVMAETLGARYEGRRISRHVQKCAPPVFGVSPGNTSELQARRSNAL